MNKRIRAIRSLLSLGCLVGTVYAYAGDSDSLQLWYKQPAEVANLSVPWGGQANNLMLTPKSGHAWEARALPIGNGRIGAMVFGGDVRERLALNEDSLWTGGENPSLGYEYGPLSGRDQFGSFQPFADLIVDFPSDGQTTNYKRALSIRDGIATTEWTRNGVKYQREVYASYPDQVIVMTCRADRPGALSSRLMLKPNHTTQLEAGAQGLSLSGTLVNGEQFEGKVVVKTDGKISAHGGKVDMPVTYQNNVPVMDTKSLPWLQVEGATTMTVIISLATDYVMDFRKNWKGEVPTVRNQRWLKNALAKSPEALKEAHLKDIRGLFDRMQIDLGTSSEAKRGMATDERIADYKNTPQDPDLEELLFQYGRYLLISSSRPGTLPANLQGIWNDHVQQAWASDYHSDINIEMNYWLANPTNLAECEQPLLDFFWEMREPSIRETKKAFKGRNGQPARGWTIAFSQNPFGGHGWAWNIPGSSWYACHMWERYAFTGDKKYLAERAYPMMKEICQFWEDRLKELGEHGICIGRQGSGCNSVS